ncbi:hypothetical protein FS749_012745 [Ceratobasidium sp. UAMH 11750]|nr:hypothetical protein FS749_012745 [Ceratobasidium sp. UAMH 11750]
MSPLTATTSPSSSEPVSLPTSTPPTSVPNTPCPSCAQLSPRGDVAGLPSPLGRRKALSPRSPPCKTTPLHAGTDPLTVFAVTAEQEKQRDFSGLLKRSTGPLPPSSSVFSGLVRGVKSWFGRINNLVDLAASAPFTTAAVDGTCPLSPVMGGAIARDIGMGTRRRAASAPPTPSVAPLPRIHRRRRSLVRALPGAPTSPYGYRVRPQQVEAAFPADERVEEDLNVVATPIPNATVELQDILPRVEVEPPADVTAPAPASIDLKAPPEGRRKRASRSRSPSRRKKERKEKVVREVEVEVNRDEVTRSRAVIDSKYWRVLAGEMEQRRRGGVEVAFMVRLAVEEGRNLPIFTSEEQQAATGEIVVGGVWKASMLRWRVGGVGKGQTRIRSGLVNEMCASQSEVSDVVSDSSSSMM